jgi:hypothetical protein
MTSSEGAGVFQDVTNWKKARNTSAVSSPFSKIAIT